MALVKGDLLLAIYASRPKEGFHELGTGHYGSACCCALVPWRSAPRQLRGRRRDIGASPNRREFSSEPDHLSTIGEPLAVLVLGGQLKSHTWGHFKTAHHPVGSSKSHT
jgi:hypothetical protein